MALWSSTDSFEPLYYWAVQIQIPLWRASSNRSENQADSDAFNLRCLSSHSWYLLFFRLFHHMDYAVLLLPLTKERKAALWKSKPQVLIKKTNQTNKKTWTFFFLCFLSFSVSGNFRMFTWDAGDPKHWSLCFESGLGLNLGSPHLRWALLTYCYEVALPVSVLLAVIRNATLQQGSLLIWLLSKQTTETFTQFLFSW